ncbi:MAG: hypothetical protein H0T89_36090 [Deltaproteobacteria bacterium]|nr:hypothetical protein [Deltaproteobacteria bacterium]MDQ3299461.1 hypothetical protein [Myxococcota bacterium]
MNRLAVALFLASCGSDTGSQDPGDGVDAMVATGDPELPPTGHPALKAWLADGHYLAWACEDAPHPARPPGAHGTNRICSNAALTASATGTYPVGAASVKELYRGTEISGYAVGLKVSTGTDANSWYWYEAFGDSVVADRIGQSLCAGCHEDAPRDYVFTHVR